MSEFIKHKLIKEGMIEYRLYQEVLAARVLDNGNSLVVAPTALGKTIIAVLVSVFLLEKDPKQKILFLAPTKPLAVQHQKSFRKLTKIDEEKIALLTGSTKPKERQEIWKNSIVISATPQSIENDLVSGRISLEDVSLAIFDEAHRAIGDYAYVFIAQQYMRQAKKPLILALTASPGGTEEKIQTICKNLFIKNIEIKTHADADVKPYSKEIEINWIKVELPEEFLEIKKLLEEFMKNKMNFLKKIGYKLPTRYLKKKDLLLLQSKIRKDMVAKGKQHPYLFQAVSKVAAVLKVSHAKILLETQGIASLNNYFSKMEKESKKSGSSKAVKLLLKDEKISKAIYLTKKLNEKNVVHPKQQKLLEILSKQFKNKPDSRVLVFNHYRDSVKQLVLAMKKVKEIKAKEFIGQTMKESDKGMSQKEQIQTIKEFEKGKYNTLVASSVAEEGLDIPTVDLVIFYEPVPSEIRTIQRRGRTGRLSKGKAIILITKNTGDEAFYWASVNKEKKMHQTLRKMQHVLIPKKFDKQTTLLKFADEIKDKVLIYVDTREQSSAVARELIEKGCIIKVKQLDVGDYVLSDEIIVERKTIEDFTNSLLDGRLFNQLISLAENCKQPLMLVEGNKQELFAIRNIHRNAIIGALTSIALNYRVPILFTDNATETAEYLFVTAKREQLGKEKEIRLRVGKKGLELNELQQFVVESLPLVGPKMAKALLKHFGSVKAIFNASKEELKKVENLGPKKASLIRKVIDRKFKEE